MKAARWVWGKGVEKGPQLCGTSSAPHPTKTWERRSKPSHPRSHSPSRDEEPQEPTPEHPLTTYSATPAQQGRTQARLLRKWKLYQRIHELHEDGMSLRKIGEELGLARGTVRKYFRQPPEQPLPTPRPLRASKLDPYEDYLLTALEPGMQGRSDPSRNQCTGFSGCATWKAYVAHLRISTADGSATPQATSKALSPRSLRWLLTRKRKDL